MESNSLSYGPIVVSAFGYKSGKRTIQVSDCNGSREAVENIKRRDRLHGSSSLIEDWQTGVYDTLAEARSGIMKHFGMSWFNMARAQINNPPVALGMCAPARH
ncbi:hypothetical protein [Azospirillum sp. TSO5]|uniref:hypothetical protein n=1 Tax=Azospirillum sp. TSO5 TaxID=716760 RepID=UPI000D60CE97|nr:hypothetical protein [Azospirillum sp. TSO5]PWC95451.1 hypothetical protein TSO5_10515 [Azospirillum sp. TSO5]